LCNPSSHFVLDSQSIFGISLSVHCVQAFSLRGPLNPIALIYVPTPAKCAHLLVSVKARHAAGELHIGGVPFISPTFSAYFITTRLPEVLGVFHDYSCQYFKFHPRQATSHVAWGVKKKLAAEGDGLHPFMGNTKLVGIGFKYLPDRVMGHYDPDVEMEKDHALNDEEEDEWGHRATRRPGFPRNALDVEIGDLFLMPPPPTPPGDDPTPPATPPEPAFIFAPNEVATPPNPLAQPPNDELTPPESQPLTLAPSSAGSPFDARWTFRPYALEGRLWSILDGIDYDRRLEAKRDRIRHREERAWEEEWDSDVDSEEDGIPDGLEPERIGDEVESESEESDTDAEGYQGDDEAPGASGLGRKRKWDEVDRSEDEDSEEDD
jgi:hypothetical protein